MSDIREGMAQDPYRESLSDPASTLRPEKPAGSELILNDDGTASFYEADADLQKDAAHFDNLAEDMDERDLQVIANDLLDAIEVDREARQRRDKIYEEGLRRCGLGDEIPSGAPFNGSSKVVVPLMIEAVADYSSRVVSEMLPPEGPCKAAVIGQPSDDKNDRAQRVVRYMNYQLTQEMPSFAAEVEAGYSQQSIQGAFYLKPVVIDGRADVEVVYGDKVIRPWSDGDFYKQQRITHEMEVDAQTFEQYVETGLWRDVVFLAATSDNLEQTTPSTANDRIIGRDTPIENVDDIRPVFETSTFLRVKADKRELLPYLVTIDKTTRRVLSIYRNWEKEDANRSRLDFLIEFPFLPWRGGVPLGLAHMIGSLSGAASGALRALLDSALLATMPTGVKLKGGVTAGGQNIRPQPGSTVEVAGSLATDPDIRKTYMQLEFPQPSTVLFQVLGMLIDLGRGVVRTTFDEFNKMNGEMPVGTANMMIEQGLKTFGAVFARQHRAMARFLRMLWLINKKTVVNELVVDEFGELLVTREDFQGPMTVVPVSDPRIFTDTQRMAGAQLIASRSDAYVQKGLPSPYKIRAVELSIMRSAKVAQPEQYLQDAPEPRQLNAVAENVAASRGLPLKAFPGQDHEAHIAQHGAYLMSPIFGANPAIAAKLLPVMIEHMSEHVALWYDDAMKIATNEVLRQTFNDERITVDALETVKGLQVQLDRLTAELTPIVMQDAQKQLQETVGIIQQAQKMLKDMQPPQPMDPSVVAAQDVKRQEKADEAKAQLEAKKEENRAGAEAQRIQNDAASKERQAQLDALKADKDSEHKSADLAERTAANERRDAITAAGLDVTRQGQDVTVETARIGSETQLHVAAGNNETQLELQDRKSATDLEKADKAAEAAKEAAKLKPKPQAKSE